MLFKTAFPDAKNEDEVVPEVLKKTERIFACDVCKTLTGFRFLGGGFETPCCGDECLDEMEDRLLNP